MTDVSELVGAILTASRVLVGVSAQSLAAVEDIVTLTQFRTLVVLHSRGQMNLNRLADLLGVNSSTAMRMIDRLLAAGLVTRADNPTNRREVLLDLTPVATRLVRRVTACRHAEISKIVKNMPAAQRGALIEAMRSFADAAGEPDAAPDSATALGW